MYSVFLVEDERLIRDGIKNLIAWNEYGFSFAGEASDGEVAWPLIQKAKPDIVITDIRMPFMDGLNLSRLIKKEIPETTIIILSGYDDFSYAKEAISIGVNQYLLKPLTKDQLIDVLCKIKEKKDKEKEQTSYAERFSKEVNEYLTSSRRGFFDALVSGRYSLPELLERAEKLGFDFMAQSYNIVLLLLEENFEQVYYSSQTAAVQEMICESFPENDSVALFCIGVDIIVFLVKSDTDTVDECTEECVKEISSICVPLEKIMKWSVVVGNSVSRLSNIAQCYHEARRKMFHLDRQDVSVVDFNPNSMDAAKMDPRISEKFLANGLQEEIPTFVKDYIDTVGRDAMQSLLFRQYIVLNLQFSINAFLEKLDCPNTESSEGDKTQLLGALKSLPDAENYLCNLFENAIKLRDNTAKNKYNGMMQKALEYMGENYSNPDISLISVAQTANVSATYFSAVFSQQIGKTFIEHLTNLRMDAAKELLRCTDKSSGDIAFEVGYNDPHYFSFLFKKVNGCSPRDYRRGGKNDD